MFGMPIDGLANVFCDNYVVVKNTTIRESMLANKHNATNSHAVCEAVAVKIIRVGKEDGMANLADLFQKGAHCQSVSSLMLPHHVLIQ
jgi:hypothetical protein